MLRRIKLHSLGKDAHGKFSFSIGALGDAAEAIARQINRAENARLREASGGSPCGGNIIKTVALCQDTLHF
jgi:hypothetical protein